MPRSEVMRHMLAGENLALMVPKQHKEGEFGALATKFIGAHKSVAAYDINYHFPLYLYPSAERGDLFASHRTSEGKPNLSLKLVSALAESHGREPTAEEMFHYTYAILYAPSFREKYSEFLRIDFPRVPFTRNRALFADLAALGVRLVNLHLLQSPELDPPACRFEGQGDAGVARTEVAGVPL